MSALKSANKELKGMMKTVKIQEIDNLQHDILDLMDESNEIQESVGRSYNVPHDVDEEDLMGELDALEADMGFEMEGEGVPSCLQPDNEPDYEELNLPSAPCGHAVPARRVNNQKLDNHSKHVDIFYRIRNIMVLGFASVSADMRLLSYSEVTEFCKLQYFILKLTHRFLEAGHLEARATVKKGRCYTAVCKWCCQWVLSYVQGMEDYSIFGDDVDPMVCYLLETSSRRKGKATK